MRYLADACALIAFLLEPEADTLMKASAPLMRGGEVFVSPVTVWEITRKIAIGKLGSPLPPHASMSDMLRAHDFGFMPLAWDDAEHANRLPLHHKDPMDRMLIATALRNDLTVITNDQIFAAYGVRVIW